MDGEPERDEVSSMLWINRGSQTLTQKVVEGLRTAILSGHFEPGQRLVERTLCEMTGVSRTAVREALRSLETEGLVVNVASRGPEVARPSVEEAEEIYEVRKLLETRAVELFTKRMTDLNLSSLEEAMVGMENALKAADLAGVNKEKQRFYKIILDVSGNHTISRILNQLYAKIAILRNMTMIQENRTEAAVSELRAIFDAIRERDIKAARKACLRHVETAGSVALEALSRPRAL